MRQSQRNGDNLAESNSAVVWRHTLMPIGSETSFHETLHTTFGEFAILKATAGKHDMLLLDPACHGDNHLRESVVEFSGDNSGAASASISSTIASIIGPQSAMKRSLPCI